MRRLSLYRHEDSLIALLLLFSCTARPAAMTATHVQPVVVHRAPGLVAGDAAEGRQM